MRIFCKSWERSTTLSRSSPFLLMSSTTLCNKNYKIKLDCKICVLKYNCKYIANNFRDTNKLTFWEVCLELTCDRSSLGLILLSGRFFRKKFRDLLVFWNSWFLPAASCKRPSLRQKKHNEKHFCGDKLKIIIFI